jgi:hypothetical protein
VSLAANCFIVSVKETRREYDACGGPPIICSRKEIERGSMKIGDLPTDG